MARLIYSEIALGDFERLTEFLLDGAPEIALETVQLIEEAVDVLRNHPLIGRPVEAGLRELIVSRGRTGYVSHPGRLTTRLRNSFGCERCQRFMACIGLT